MGRYVQKKRLTPKQGDTMSYTTTTCLPKTTTTVLGTTTTLKDTTTTQLDTTTSDSQQPIGTPDTTAPTVLGTVVAVPAQLPRTGADSLPLASAGLGLVLIGALVVRKARMS